MNDIFLFSIKKRYKKLGNISKTEKENLKRRPVFSIFSYANIVKI